MNKPNHRVQKLTALETVYYFPIRSWKTNGDIA
jgi:hypothetical protein